MFGPFSGTEAPVVVLDALSDELVYAADGPEGLHVRVELRVSEHLRPAG
jgi:hypothetical protein